jgi:hypothetical protein
MRGGGRSARTDFTLITECTPESSGCNSVYSVATITNKTRPAGSFSSASQAGRLAGVICICLFSGLVLGFLDSGPCCPIPWHKGAEIRFAFRVLVEFRKVIFTEVRDCKCMTCCGVMRLWLTNSEFEPITLGSKDCCATHRVPTYPTVLLLSCTVNSNYVKIYDVDTSEFPLCPKIIVLHIRIIVQYICKLLGYSDIANFSKILHSSVSKQF